MRRSIIRQHEKEFLMSSKNPPPPPVLPDKVISLFPANNNSPVSQAPKTSFKEKSSQKLKKNKPPSEAKQSSTPELIAASESAANPDTTTVVIDGANIEIKTNKDTTTTEEQKKSSSSKMKKWPDNPSGLLHYKDIASPLKEIIKKGYRLFRREEVKNFEYDGFNIGKQELKTLVSPKTRFSQQCIEYEKKFGHTLMDSVLHIMFLMGIEQGRRVGRRESKPIESLIDTLEKYREINKDLRIKIDELEVILELKESHPNLPSEEFKTMVMAGVSARRNKRIEQLKAELKLDVSKSTFQFKTPTRAKFKDLETIAKTLTKEKCSEDQWLDILKQHGWTLKEWKDKCKKKDVKTDFS